jgi:Acetyltransferase (GNAT) family
MTIVTQAEPADVHALADIAEEMDRFYGAAKVEPAETRMRQISEALFHDPPSAYALLAWNNNRLIGFVSYSFLWPAVGLTRSLYLKELYVSEAARGQVSESYLCSISTTSRPSRAVAAWNGQRIETTWMRSDSILSLVFLYRRPSYFIVSKAMT